MGPIEETKRLQESDLLLYPDCSMLLIDEAEPEWDPDMGILVWDS